MSFAIIEFDAGDEIGHVTSLKCERCFSSVKIKLQLFESV